MGSCFASPCATLSDMSDQNLSPTPGHQREPEHQGSIWSHPYMVYIYLTLALFGFLIFMGWMALQNGWIPKRG